MHFLRLGNFTGRTYYILWTPECRNGLLSGEKPACGAGGPVSPLSYTGVRVEFEREVPTRVT